MTSNKIKPIIINIFVILGTPCLANSIKIPTIIEHANKSKPKHISSFSQSFNRKTIQQHGDNTVVGFLRQQNIVQLKTSSSNQTQSMIAMRGFGSNASNNILLLIDEIPISSFTDTGINLDSILVNNIGSIKMKPGSFGSLYGNSAVAGVVDLTTHQSKKNEAYTDFGWGNLGQHQLGVYISRKSNNKLGYNIGGLASTINHYEPHNQQDNFNFNANLQYYGNKNISSLNLLSFHNIIDIPTAYTWGQPKPTKIRATTFWTTGNIAYITNKHLLNNNWFWNSNLIGYDSDLHSNLSSMDVNERGIMWQNKLVYKKSYNAGIDIQGNQYKSTSAILDDYASGSITQIYNNITIPLPHNINLILGTRYATQQLNIDSTYKPKSIKKHSVWVNSEGVNYNFNKNLKWYLRRDTNFRFVNAEEELFLTSGNSLKTQTGTSYETGINWNNYNKSFAINIYQLKLKNELAYSVLPLPYGEMSNLSPTTRTGIDGIAKFAINSKLNLGSQLDLVNPRFKSGQFKNNLIPQVSELNTGISVTFHQITKWSTRITESYHSSFYPADDQQNLGPKMPGYFLTNLNFQKHFKQIVFNIQLYNIFNKHYVRYAQYIAANPSYNIPSKVSYYPADGIMVLGTIKVNLE